MLAPEAAAVAAQLEGVVLEALVLFALTLA